MSGRSEKLTLIVIPQTDKNTLNFHLPLWALGGIPLSLAVLLMLTLVTLAVSIREHRGARVASKELDLVREEAGHKEQQLQYMAQRVREIEMNLSRVQELEQEVRRLLLQQESNQPAPGPSLDIQPTARTPSNSGGPVVDLNEKTALRDEAQRLFSAVYPVAIPGAPSANRRALPKVNRSTPTIRATSFPSRDPEFIDRWLTGIQDTEARLTRVLPQIAEAYRNKLDFDGHRPIGRPLPGRITDAFGWRRSPFTGEQDWHDGIDIAGNWGETVEVTGAGEVIYSDWTFNGYGYTVIIDHGYGFTTLYAHNSSLLVTVGKQVQRGDPIARVGSTGHSTGPHVHYEVHLWGQPVNPADHRN